MVDDILRQFPHNWWENRSYRQLFTVFVRPGFTGLKDHPLSYHPQCCQGHGMDHLSILPDNW